MGDPSKWACTQREKLCFLHGLVIGMFARSKRQDFLLLHEATDEQIIDSLIRMLQPPEPPEADSATVMKPIRAHG